VTPGRTGLKLSRLGMGAGSNSGNVQLGLGREAFNKLVRYAFARGIAYFDCARGYKTLPWIGDALAQLPREKVFLLTKIGGNPEKPGEVIDGSLKTYKTDYIDCLPVHCMVKASWTGEQKRLMDAVTVGFKSAAEIDEAIERMNRALA
jgi:predicted aldo/keto reductase-like oxidoreductase